MKITLQLGDVMLYAEVPLHPGTAPGSKGQWNVSPHHALGVVLGDMNSSHVVLTPEEWNIALTAGALR